MDLEVVDTSFSDETNKHQEPVVPEEDDGKLFRESTSSENDNKPLSPASVFDKEKSMDGSHKKHETWNRSTRLLDSDDESVELSPTKTVSGNSKMRNLVFDDDSDNEAVKPVYHERTEEEPMDFDNLITFDKRGSDDEDDLVSEPSSTTKAKSRIHLVEGSDEDKVGKVFKEPVYKERVEEDVGDFDEVGASERGSSVGRESESGKVLGKPRKERTSKMQALEDIRIHQETQRLIRETKVALPVRKRPQLSLDDFLNLAKPPCPELPKPAEEHISIVNVDDDFSSNIPVEAVVEQIQLPKFEIPLERPCIKRPAGGEFQLVHAKEILVKPKETPKQFISRFLQHAHQPLRKVEPRETHLQIMCRRQDSVTGAEMLEPQDVQINLEPEITLSYKLQNISKPGAKLPALKSQLEEEMAKKKVEILRIQLEKYELAKAEEEAKNRPRERKSSKKKDKAQPEAEVEEAEMTDSEGDTESEPDEIEIVDDNYGKDEKEPEYNEFADAEAVESDVDEVQEKLVESDEDNEQDQSDEEELNQALARDERISEEEGDSALEENDILNKSAAYPDSDVDDDPLAGLAVISENEPIRLSSPKMDIDEEMRPADVPGSLANDLDVDQREELLALCSFAPESQMTENIVQNPEPCSFAQEGEVLPNSIMPDLDLSQDRQELLNCLSCDPADFQTQNAVPLMEAARSPLPASSWGQTDDDDDVPLRRQASDFHARKINTNRRRMLLEEDEEVPNTEAVKSPKNWHITGTESDSDREEMEQEAEESMPKKRFVRPEADSDAEADDEEKEQSDSEEELDNEDEFVQPERPTKPTEDEELEFLARQFKISEFLEDEAALSEDEKVQVSDDECEDDADKPTAEDLAFMDGETDISISKQMRQNMPLYMEKQQQDDDEEIAHLEDFFFNKNNVDQLLGNIDKINKNTFVEEGIKDLVGDGDGLSEDEGAEPGELANAWRVQRSEREQLWKDLNEKQRAKYVEEEQDVLLKDNVFSIFCREASSRGKAADLSMVMETETITDEANGETVVQVKKRGFFAKGREVLTRMASVVDVDLDKTLVPPPQVMLSRSAKNIPNPPVVRKPARSAGQSNAPVAKRQRLDKQPLRKSLFSIL